MRVVFFGNHTVGVAALSSLLDVAEVTGVIAHPNDPEDGVRYESVHDFARARGLPVIRARGRDAGVHDFVTTAAPDLLWVTDYRYLLPPSILALAPLGAVNLHPSLLPAYRGRAPLNWAILRGETEVGLTAHLIDDGMDSGDILAQHRLSLTTHDTVGDALQRLMPVYAALPRKIVQGFDEHSLVRTQQDHAYASVFPARTPADGRIDWSKPAREIHNLVRAVSAPYPGAFAHISDQPITVWRTRLGEHSEHGEPGTVVAVQLGVPTVQCGIGTVKLLETTQTATEWRAGDRLT